VVPNPDQDDFDGDGMGDACDMECSVPEGPDSYAWFLYGSDGIVLRFDYIEPPGGTLELEISGEVPGTLPGGFQIEPQVLPTYYYLTEYFDYTGVITMCISGYDDIGMSEEDEYAL
jgi:hypothetical protein